jgi:hypothetical protein
MPADGIPRPKLEFEPVRTRQERPPATPAPPVVTKPRAKPKPALADTDTSGVEL